ncbi:MAG: arginase family protein [archaeon]
MISLPYSDGEHKACEKAPKAIIEQFKGIFSNEFFRKISILEYKEAPLDAIPQDKIYIGGDHSVTYHILKQHPTEGLLVFDAHPDVFQQFDTPTHLDYLKFLVEEGIVKTVIVVGIRNPHPTEIDYFKEKGITYITCKGINLEESCDGIMEKLRSLKDFHISIDIDVLDPAFAPGVSYPEPAGLTTRQLLYYLQRVRILKNLKSIDLVEVNPETDINNITAKTAAKIIAEFL